MLLDDVLLDKLRLAVKKLIPETQSLATGKKIILDHKKSTFFIQVEGKTTQPERRGLEAP